MSQFDAKADTPETTVAAGDKIPFGDVSADAWNTITAAKLAAALVAVCDDLAALKSALGISGSGGVWGSITGTLSSQTDLAAAMNAKASTSGPVTITSGSSANSGLTIQPPAGTEVAGLFRVMHSNGVAALKVDTSSYTVTIGASSAGVLYIGGGPSNGANLAPLYLTLDSGGDIRGHSYSAVTITNATLRWPSNSPDLTVHRATGKVLNVGDGSSGGGTLRSIPLTPATLTADQNNYAPSVARYYRLSTDGSPRRITGWSLSQVDGQEFWAINTDATQTITIGHQDASSTAANRVISGSGADIALAPGECAHHVYDAASSRFRAWKV